MEDAAAAAGLSLRQAFRWLARHRAGGELALQDRSSAPARCRRTDADTVAAIERLRRQRRTGPQIARRLACHGLPSAWCCAGSILEGSVHSKSSQRSFATSARNPANSSTSISRSSVASMASATASPAIALDRATSVAPGGISPRRHRRCLPPALKRGLGQRESQERRRFHPPRTGLVQALRRQRRADHDRQWIGL